MSFYISIEWMGYITAHRTITDLIKTATDLLKKTHKKTNFRSCHASNHTSNGLPSVRVKTKVYTKAPHHLTSLLHSLWSSPILLLTHSTHPASCLWFEHPQHASSARPLCSQCPLPPDTSMTHPSHWGHLWPARWSGVTTIPNLKPSLLSHLA